MTVYLIKNQLRSLSINKDVAEFDKLNWTLPLDTRINIQPGAISSKELENYCEKLKQIIATDESGQPAATSRYFV